MNSGTILYDKEFQFSNNGVIIDKLIIVLCEFGINFLVLSTTSQQHSKNKTAGCQIKDRQPNYFLPQGSCWFNKDTWVELSEFHEMDFYILEQKKADRIVLHRSVLPTELMKDIIKCALTSEDIEGFYLKELEKTYNKM